MSTRRISANELNVTVRKAAIGAGVARGLAEEIAQATVAAEMMGHGALSALAVALASQNPSAQALWRRSGQHWTSTQATAVNDAPSMIDLASAGFEVSTESIDHPALLIGCALMSQMAMEIAFDDGDWQVASNIVAPPNGPCSARIRPTKANNSYPAMKPCTVEEDLLNTLNAFANRLLVPADNATRGDAGAGNNDND